MVFVLLGEYATLGSGCKVSEKHVLHSLREMKCIQGSSKTCSWIKTNSKIQKLPWNSSIVVTTPNQEIRVQLTEQD